MTKIKYLSCLLLGERSIALYLSLKSHTDLILLLAVTICISAAHRSPGRARSLTMLKLDVKTC